MTAQPPPYTGPPPTGGYRHPPQPPPYLYPYPPPHPGGYPPPADPRPGVVTAAAVLAWVAAGLLLIAAGLLFFGAAFLHGFDSANGTNTGGYVAELTADALLDVLAAGLLIAGGVGLTNRNGVGRVLTTIASVVVVIESLYWLTRWAERSEGAVVGYAVIFALLAATIIGLSWSTASGAWLSRRP